MNLATTTSLRVDSKDLPFASKGYRDDQQEKTNSEQNIMQKRCHELDELSDSECKIPLKRVQHRETSCSLVSTLSATSGILDTNKRTCHEEVHSKHEQTTSKIPKIETTVIEGKHIAKRGISQWLDYGDPKIWELEFEKAVVDAVDSIKRGNLKPSSIIEHFAKIRSSIASKRKNPHANLFGSRRDVDSKHFSSKSCFTKMNRQHRAYGYALERAVKIPYDEKHFLELQSEDGRFWAEKHFYRKRVRGSLRYGLVQGFIDGEPIPLTQYIFCPRTDCRRNWGSERWFGTEDDNYIGDKNESGIWLHTGREQIPSVLKHIEALIDKAFTGDLTVIPRIHWWYVHLAPTWRGSGGIAEMLIKTLCRLHNIDLPPWKEGVAPSVEVLLEPDEDKFCSNYPSLFMQDLETLNTYFKAGD